jgi:hypothetical protein
MVRLQEAKQRRAEAERTEKDRKVLRATLESQEQARLSAEVGRLNAAAQSLRSSRRRGAGYTTAQHAYGITADVPTNPASLDEMEKEETEMTKSQKRRERQRANRQAQAQRKKKGMEEKATEQFLRETAKGFTEKQTPLEPTTGQKKNREPKFKQKQTAEHSDAEALQIGLWEAKLTRPAAKGGVVQKTDLFKQSGGFIGSKTGVD